MSLASPVFLLLLIPWGGMALLVLRSYRPRVMVPFLDLWPRDEVGTSRNRGWRVPPLPIVLLMMALLAGVLALAGPVRQTSGGGLQHLTIVVDRGVRMLAGGRLERTVERFIRETGPLLAAEARIQVMDHTGRAELAGPSGLDRTLLRPASAVDTQPALAGLLRRLDTTGDSDPVVLLSDLSVREKFPQVIAFAPEGTLRNIGIVSTAAAEGQLLLTLRNDSPERAVGVTLQAANGTVQHTLTLPEAGRQQQYTLACPAGLPLKVQLEVMDDLPDDNTCWILPERLTPELHLGAALPEAVRRFARQYARVRPAMPEADIVQIGAPAETVTASRAAIAAPASVSVDLSGIQVLPDHPVLRHVRLPSQAMATRLPPPGGEWEVLLEINGLTLLAADPNGRRVWVGFDAPDWSRETDFVLFWTNVLEFLSPSASAMVPESLNEGWKRIDPKEPLPPELHGLRQGLYARGQNRIAVHVPAPVFPAQSASNESMARLSALAAKPAQRPMAHYLWLAAAVLSALASLVLLRASATRPLPSASSAPARRRP